jgi:HEAT repeat protein
MYKEVASLLPDMSGWRVAGVLMVLFTVVSLGCSGGKKQDPVLDQETIMVDEGVMILREGTSVQRDSVIRTFNNLSHSELLHPYLAETDISVRIGIVSALGNLKDLGSVGPLNTMLLESDDYLLRETVIWALGELNDTSSVSVLIGIMQDTTDNLDMRLGIPITLATFINTSYAGKVEQAFVNVLQNMGNDLELCSYVAVGILEVLEPGNYELFRGQLPLLRQMAQRRLAESGDDGIYTNFQLTIEELEKIMPDPV